jgi:hypothetical protein
MVNLSAPLPRLDGVYHNLTTSGGTRSSALLPPRTRHADRNLINRFPSKNRLSIISTAASRVPRLSGS